MQNRIENDFQKTNTDIHLISISKSDTDTNIHIYAKTNIKCF